MILDGNTEIWINSLDLLLSRNKLKNFDTCI